MSIYGVTNPVLRIGGGGTLRGRFVENNGCSRLSSPEPAAAVARNVIQL